MAEIDRQRVVGQCGAGDNLDTLIHFELLQIGRLQPLVGIEVRVMRQRVVLDFVLDELEAGQADAVEGQVVGAAGVGEAQRGGTHVAEGLEPLAEGGAHRLIPLEIDAADLAGAVVEVEIRLELGEPGVAQPLAALTSRASIYRCRS